MLLESEVVMPYPDDFHGTPYDAEKCVRCGHREYTNDDGLCDECEYRERKALKEIELEKMDSASHRAYLYMMMDIANVKAAKELGLI